MSWGTLIDEYKTLNISTLSRAGFLEPVPPGKARKGVVTVSDYWGHTAKIEGAGVVRENRQFIAVAYTHGGNLRAYTIELQFTPSNLPTHGNTGYYYFLCPETGQRCRKLYLVNGTFVSRKAFKALYFWQAASHKCRTLQTAGVLLPDLIRHEIGNPKHRKRTYRGKLTPYGRKLARWAAKI